MLLLDGYRHPGVISIHADWKDSMEALTDHRWIDWIDLLQTVLNTLVGWTFGKWVLFDFLKSFLSKLADAGLAPCGPAAGSEWRFSASLFSFWPQLLRVGYVEYLIKWCSRKQTSSRKWRIYKVRHGRHERQGRQRTQGWRADLADMANSFNRSPPRQERLTFRMTTHLTLISLRWSLGATSFSSYF